MNKQTNTDTRTAAKIAANSELYKRICKESYYGIESFEKDAAEYIKAIKERRMLCTIKSVSNSGMSRNIKFHSCQKTKTGYYFRNYWTFFKTLGYTPASSDRDTFRIGGCGMDMIFHTNYTIIHKLHKLGFINKKQCENLAQQTPVIL